MRPRGGVVTQRTANPCTPVQFRARPPKKYHDRRQHEMCGPRHLSGADSFCEHGLAPITFFTSALERAANQARSLRGDPPCLIYACPPEASHNALSLSSASWATLTTRTSDGTPKMTAST